MGHALIFGASLMQQQPQRLAQTIVLSGDETSNDRYRPQTAHKDPVIRAINDNGLFIHAAGFEEEPFLNPLFQSDLLHGPGAFLEVAQGFDGSERSVSRNLELDLQGLNVGDLRRVAQ